MCAPVQVASAAVSKRLSKLSLEMLGILIKAPHSVADIVTAVEECEGLTALRLSGNSLGVEAAEAIADAIRQKPTLRRALWSDLFVSRLKTEIPPAVVSTDV